MSWICVHKCRISLRWTQGEIVMCICVFLSRMCANCSSYCLIPEIAGVGDSKCFFIDFFMFLQWHQTFSVLYQLYKCHCLYRRDYSGTLSFKLFHALLVLSTILLLNVLFTSGLSTSIFFPSTLLFLLFLTDYFTLSQFPHWFIIQFNMIFNTVKLYCFQELALTVTISPFTCLILHQLSSPSFHWAVLKHNFLFLPFLKINLSSKSGPIQHD